MSIVDIANARWLLLLSLDRSEKAAQDDAITTVRTAAERRVKDYTKLKSDAKSTRWGCK